MDKGEWNLALEALLKRKRSWTKASPRQDKEENSTQTSTKKNKACLISSKPPPTKKTATPKSEPPPTKKTAALKSEPPPTKKTAAPVKLAEKKYIKRMSEKGFQQLRQLVRMNLTITPKQRQQYLEQKTLRKLNTWLGWVSIIVKWFKLNHSFKYHRSIVFHVLYVYMHV